MTGATPEYPHELAVAELLDAVGAGALAEQLRPVVLGYVDQMSIYLQCIPMAALRIDGVTIREGAEKSFLMCRHFDRGRPLRLRQATEHWELYLTTSNTDDFVQRVNARRRDFLVRYKRSVLRRLCLGIADRLEEYALRRPGAKLVFNWSRFMEDSLGTWFVIDFDNRGVPLKTDTYQQPYMVQ